ncbi:hypothetical protein [Bdellovibrio sp. HCB-110]|uniref:hypothetical protein n=1 Tax=Bdellovibrio sp. HCB-110 TaxID=3391182 RepID=UPI0039B6C899
MSDYQEFKRVRAEFLRLGFEYDTFGSRFAELVQRALPLWNIESLEEDDLNLEFEGRHFEHGFTLSLPLRPFFHVAFKNCTFDGHVEVNNFSSAKFENCEIDSFYIGTSYSNIVVVGGTIRILDTQESGGAHCIFQNVKIEKFYPSRNLNKIAFKKCIFEDAIEMRPSSAVNQFTLVVFEKSIFRCSPNFLKSSFAKDVVFVRCTFEVLTEFAAVYYRDLKQKAVDNHDEFSSTHFASLEMKSKHTDLEFGSEYFLSAGYKLLNDYGLDPFRPVWILFWQGIAAFLVWGLAVAWTGSAFVSGSERAPLLSEGWQLVYLTFLSVLGPLRLFGTFDLVKLETFSSQVILWFFTAMASLLWFFIILAVRRRFKVG